MEDRLDTLIRRRKIGTWICGIGILSIAVIGSMPLSQFSKTGVHGDPRTFFFVTMMLFLAASIWALALEQERWNSLEADLIDYANRRARYEGTTPDLNFLYFFESRYPGDVEWNLLRGAYYAMNNWEPRRNSVHVLRKSNSMIDEREEEICAACGEKNYLGAEYCKSCGRPLAA